MPKPFDATLKELITSYPADWLAQLGVPITAPPEVISPDLSTVTAAADTLIKVGELVVHIDLESGPDDLLARRMLLYNVLAHYHTGLPVRTIVILLRSNAVGRGPKDGVEYAPNAGVSELRFRFETVKAWELPSAELLKAGVGFLPLAALGKPPAGKSREQALPEVARVLVDRIQHEAPARTGMLLTASIVLASMHVPFETAKGIFTNMFSLRELDGYKSIMKEGAALFAHQVIRKQAAQRFGEPTEKQASKLDLIEDLDRLERIMLAAPLAKDWDDLLATK